MLEKGALSGLIYFFCRNLSPRLEMKTQTDTANLKSTVVKRVLGRGGESAPRRNGGKRAQPSQFVCSDGNGLQSHTGLFERRQVAADSSGHGVWGGGGAGAAPGLKLRARLAALDEPRLGLRLCGRFLGPRSHRAILKPETSGGWKISNLPPPCHQVY